MFYNLFLLISKNGSKLKGLKLIEFSSRDFDMSLETAYDSDIRSSGTFLVELEDFDKFSKILQDEFDELKN